jgi:hypothetical protein
MERKIWQQDDSTAECARTSMKKSPRAGLQFSLQQASRDARTRPWAQAAMTRAISSTLFE